MTNYQNKIHTDIFNAILKLHGYKLDRFGKYRNRDTTVSNTHNNFQIIRKNNTVFCGDGMNVSFVDFEKMVNPQCIEEVN